MIFENGQFLERCFSQLSAYGPRHENGISAADQDVPLEIHLPGWEDRSICKASGVEITGTICTSTDLHSALRPGCLLEVGEALFAFNLSMREDVSSTLNRHQGVLRMPRNPRQ